MTSKRFFLTCFGASLLVVLLFVTINVSMNDYGLFGDASGRLIPIYSNERTSKYLFSFNYIPSNFEGLILGSSVSNNLNTKDIGQLEIYNGSLSGANYTELGLIAQNVIKRGNLKYIIICLHPYTMRTHGRRSSFMNPHEYWESLGSLNTFELYRNKILIFLGKKEILSNEYGYHDRNLNKKINSKKKILAAAKALIEKGEIITIDKIAYKDLTNIIVTSRAHGVKIFAYYHPHPYEINVYQKESFKSFQDKMNLLFDKKDVVWDFNSDQYLPFSKDYSNYIDHTHLSPKGARFVLNEITKKLYAERN